MSAELWQPYLDQALAAYQRCLRGQDRAETEEQADARYADLAEAPAAARERAWIAAAEALAVPLDDDEARRLYLCGLEAFNV